MKALWRTAYAAYRLARQTGSDDGYYPPTEYRFAHGTRRQVSAVNRAFAIISGPDDKLRHKAPGLILTKMKNRRAHLGRWGVPTAASFNCRCVLVAMHDQVFYGKMGNQPRTMHGLGVSPEPNPGEANEDDL